MTESIEVKRYPIYTAFRELIPGTGFIAGVEASVRAIAEQETEGWWIYGINPTALAESGESVDVAVRQFHHRLKTVLCDLAEEAESFDAFKREAEQFFAGTGDPQAEKEWAEARASVREGKSDIPGLRRISADQKAEISVLLLATLPPTKNTERGPAIAA